MRRLVLFLAVLIASGCVGDPPRLEDATAAADPVEAEAPEADDPEVRLEALRTRAAAPAQDDVAVWQRLAQQLERENGTLEAQLAQAREEASRAREDAERYRQGLERAVAELNRLGAAAAAQTLQRPPAPRLSVYTAGLPLVTPTLEGWQVTGAVWNPGPGDADGVLTIELLRNGQVIDTHNQPYRAPAGIETPFSTVFRGPTDREGSYTARVTVR